MRLRDRLPNYLTMGDITDFTTPPDFIIRKSGVDTICFDGSTGAPVLTSLQSATAIQYALDHIGTQGGMVFIKPDTYTINATLTMSKPGTVLTSGSGFIGSSLVAGLNLANGVNADMISVTAKGCTISVINCNGNKANNAASSCVSTPATAGLELTLDQVILRYASKYALELLGSSCRVQRTICEYSDLAGIYNGGDANYYVNVSSGANAAGFITHYMQFSQFVNCRSFNNISNGYLFDICFDNIFVNCASIEDGEHGFKLASGKRNIISNCIIKNASYGHDNTSDGIYLASSGASHSIYNAFVGNIITNDADTDQRYGINENDANQDYNIYIGNICTDAQTANMRLQGVNDVNQHNIAP